MHKRLISLIALGGLCLVGAFLLLSPFWLPLTGGLVAKRYGLEWESARADGYSAITLTGLKYKGGAIEAGLDHLTVPQPFPWVMGILISGRPALATGGTLTLLVEESTADQTSSDSPMDRILDTESLLRKMLPYMPTVEIDRVDLRLAANDFKTSFRDLQLKDHALVVTTTAINQVPATALRLFLGADRVSLVARNVLNEEPFFLRASLKSGKAVPEIKVEARAGLSQFIGQEETGSYLAMNLTGGREGFSIHEFQIRSSWLHGSLSDPVEFSYATKTFSGSARMEVDADLGLQKQFPASGLIKAWVDVLPPQSGETDLRFSLSGEDLVFSDVPVASLVCAGTLSYPVVRISEARLLVDDGSSLSFKGTGDLETQELLGEAAFTFSSGWLETLGLPLQINGPLSGELAFAGPFASLEHSGRLDPVSLALEKMPLLTIRLSWEGTGFESVSSEGLVESDRNGRLEFGLRVEKPAGGKQMDLFLEKAILSSFDSPAYTLQSPVTASIQTGQEAFLNSISPVNLESSEGRLVGRYNLDTGRASIGGSHLDLGFFEAWTLSELPPIIIDDFDLSVEALSPHLEAAFNISLHGTDSLLDDLSLNAAGSMDGTGIELSALEGLIEGNSFCSGSGRFPLLIHPLGDGEEGSVTLIGKGALFGNLTAEISKDLVEDFDQVPFLDLVQGSRLNLELNGTVEAPEAVVQMYLQRLDVLGKVDPRLEGLVFDQVQLDVNLSPELLKISNLQLGIKGGRLDVEGFLPTEFLVSNLETGQWDWPALLKQATLDVSLAGFKATEFESYMPAYLRPRGSLDGSVGLKPGLEVSGDLLLAGFGLRPTLYSQSIEQIRVGLKIEDTRLIIHDASAMLGESLVDLSGFFDFNDFVDPLFSVQLTGKRTPLLRTTDLLLYSDLNLSLDQTDPETPATLSGTMNLRDGVLLLDIDPLGAKTAGKAIPKPPFFSIGTSPFAQWNLDLALTGEEAIGFRSQFVNALLSVRADLSGTLENPVWVGEVRTNEGGIAFPGTKLSVSHGEFYITREQQDTIQVNVSSIGQVASYVVSMRIGGNVDEPQVSFASTPSLSSAQIFQLLATGSLDGSGVGSFGMYLGRGMFGPGGGSEGFLDRLSVEVGRDISESGHNTVDVFYDLSDRFRLRGQYDKYDAQNLDLEWEVFSK